MVETREFPPDNALMVLVPAGPFAMGLPDGDFLAEEHEKPQRIVELSAFWIDVFPVTNARFRKFLTAGGYERADWWAPAGWDWKCRERIETPLQWGQGGWDGPDQPVAGVSWYEADAYARWAGRRLPTDAEWEKAARGSDGRRYPWGNDWPTAERCNFDAAIGRTTPVGLYPAGASPYGCHDMAGNVNNWVSDWYWPRFGRDWVEIGSPEDPHCDDAMRQRPELRDVTEKTDRGGGFATPREVHEVLSCTRKVHWAPTQREPWNGFRTAMDCTAG
ncbi:MAG: formylglycine-generating enzyme family protein [Gemmataceae bacterium]|nr:formylglycine-generating enzyme family protein [Gemmataceae bacterium]